MVHCGCGWSTSLQFVPHGFVNWMHMPVETAQKVSDITLLNISTLLKGTCPMTDGSIAR
jgi:hypothetical protein